MGTEKGTFWEEINVRGGTIVAIVTVLRSLISGALHLPSSISANERSCCNSGGKGVDN